VVIPKNAVLSGSVHMSHMPVNANIKLPGSDGVIVQCQKITSKTSVVQFTDHEQYEHCALHNNLAYISSVMSEMGGESAVMTTPICNAPNSFAFTGRVVQYCNGTCMWSSWLSVTFLNTHTNTV
jgi:hypothetical protein